MTLTDDRDTRRRLQPAEGGFIKDLAAHVLDGRLDLKGLTKHPDEEVMRQLVAVKGIGRWTAEIFLMFRLGRPDILPADDLGLDERGAPRLRIAEAPGRRSGCARWVKRGGRIDRSPRGICGRVWRVGSTSDRSGSRSFDRDGDSHLGADLDLACRDRRRRRPPSSSSRRISIIGRGPLAAGEGLFDPQDAIDARAWRRPPSPRLAPSRSPTARFNASPQLDGASSSPTRQTAARCDRASAADHGRPARRQLREIVDAHFDGVARHVAARRLLAVRVVELELQIDRDGPDRVLRNPERRELLLHGGHRLARCAAARPSRSSIGSRRRCAPTPDRAWLSRCLRRRRRSTVVRRAGSAAQRLDAAQASIAIEASSAPARCTQAPSAARSLPIHRPSTPRGSRCCRHRCRAAPCGDARSEADRRRASPTSRRARRAACRCRGRAGCGGSPLRYASARYQSATHCHTLPAMS